MPRSYDFMLRARGTEESLRALTALLPDETSTVAAQISPAPAGAEVHFIFQRSVADGIDWDGCLAAAQRSLGALPKAFFRVQQLRATLDVGVFVDIAVAPAPSVRFSPEFLKTVADAGLELQVTAYPEGTAYPG